MQQENIRCRSCDAGKSTFAPDVTNEASPLRRSGFRNSRQRREPLYQRNHDYFYKAAVALFMFLASEVVGCAEEVPGPMLSKLDQLTSFFDAEVAQGRLPGAVVLIEQHGKPVYTKTFGVRDLKTFAPMTTDTIFAVRSMTKPITSVAAMMLVDDGKLSLDDPIAKYIPRFASCVVGVERQNAFGKTELQFVAPRRPPTVRDLLQQTSGISSEYESGWVKESYQNAHLFAGHFTNADFSERIAELPLTQQPGTFWRYGHSTDVLGRVIEIASQKTLYQFMKQRIFDPLGMVHTKFLIESSEELALTAEPQPSETHLIQEDQVFRSHPEFESGGAGLFSTAVDYTRFAQMLLNGGEFDGKRYLSVPSFKEMTTDHVGPGSGVSHDYAYFPGDGFGFGFGLAIRTHAGDTNPPGSIGEMKWDSAAGTYIGIDPELDMTYILMEQTDNERSRIKGNFRRIVYDAFSSNKHPTDNAEAH